jgi:endonuclease YncB( thermonuclease family)
MLVPLLALVAAGQTFTCDAIALHDVDGPIHCANGLKIRLQGIGATETDGTCRRNQPCIPGDPMVQRRIMATRVLGATIAREDRSIYGQAWFARPVALTCVATGRSHDRVTGRCRRPDGKDVSCEAIRARIAARWARYDRIKALVRCGQAGGGDALTGR